MTDEPRSVAVNALVAKRAEIASEIAALQRRIEAYQDDLVHIDHTLRLFDPTISGWDIRAKRPKARMAGYFQHGELSRRIYEAFREQEWATAAEIADRAMRDKKLADNRIRAMFIATFLVRLGQMQRAGKLAKTNDGRNVRWRLKETLRDN
jgi:hypothetical protein